MKTIGFDARGTEPGFKQHFGRGTGRYATELLKELSKLSSEETKIKALYQDDLAAKGFQKFLLDFLPCGKQTAETQLFLPQRLAKLGVDALHFIAHFDATPRCRVPYLITVLDLIPLKFPELYKAEKVNWRYHLARYFENESILNARGLLAISETTKKDVVEILKINPEKIFVTPLGVGREFVARPIAEVDWQSSADFLEVTEKHHLAQDRPILLYVGGIDPRKNIPFILKVYREILESNQLAKKPQLVLVGTYHKDKHFPELLKIIRDLKIEDEVKLLGYLAENEMLKLFHAATLKVFPSLYEGFGLPVLEAMASGLPVVAGNNSSIPEVAGSAALLLPDAKVEIWAKEIINLLSNRDQREKFSLLGVEQAKKFTWQATAEKTLKAYQYFMR